jgi:hypothetical protein
MEIEKLMVEEIVSHQRRIGERRGRRKAFGCADFLKAVKTLRTFSSRKIAEELGVNKSTISRFKNNPKNKDCLDEAQGYIDGIDDVEFTSDLSNLDVFSRVPIIKRWDEMMIKADVSPGKRRDWIGRLMNLCKYLDVHPDRLTLEDASRVNVMVRDLYRADMPAPRGLNYASLREAIRGFFGRIHEVSPLTLNNMGVTKEELKGSGKNANQKVDKYVRKRFEKTLSVNIPDYREWLEALNLCKFMFYTAGRVSAVVEFSFRKNVFNLSPELWTLTIIDKGKHGGKPQKKYFVGHALEELKKYCAQRFKIPYEDLERELPRKADTLFPSFVNAEGNARLSRVRRLVKKSLIEAEIPYVVRHAKRGKIYIVDGKPTDKIIGAFPPMHIWRHTFAQEFLSASGWNYELCASLGGWKTTHILKKHYGAMGQDPILNGLREAMGINVDKEIKELRW